MIFIIFLSLFLVRRSWKMELILWHVSATWFIQLKKKQKNLTIVFDRSSRKIMKIVFFVSDASRRSRNSWTLHCLSLIIVKRLGVSLSLESKQSEYESSHPYVNSFLSFSCCLGIANIGHRIKTPKASGRYARRIFLSWAQLSACEVRPLKY